jgi:hypothetical protein
MNPDRFELDRKRDAVVQALDELFALSVPVRGAKPTLRLVTPVDGESSDARAARGESLRMFLVRRGSDLWGIGGDLALFGALRAVMAARPHRQKWNRHVLSTLWADIGLKSDRAFVQLVRDSSGRNCADIT